MFGLIRTISALFCILLLSGCTLLRLSVGSSTEDPLKEITLKGTGKDKVLVIPIKGLLNDAPAKGILGERPSVVQEVVSRLEKAQKDDAVKALLLEINSPGGTVTTSDILYHEISVLKARTGKKVVAVFMDVAASGAYYLALAADSITAHPTGITGSVGVVMMMPKVPALMDKVGLAVEIAKSGSQKDIGSPFRPSTPQEVEIFQDLVDRLGRRFLQLVSARRRVSPEALSQIASARIYTSEDALRLGLVDDIGYLDDALRTATALAGIPEDSRIVVYRRVKYKNDTLYNTALSEGHHVPASLLAVPFAGMFDGLALPPGPYYLWLPGSLQE